MRRITPLLCLLTAIALPFGAQAGPRGSSNRGEDNPGRHDRETSRHRQPQTERHDHREAHARGGFVSVSNPNQRPLQVLLDGADVGSVAPGEQLRVGPLSRGRHEVETRFVRRRAGLSVTTSLQTVYVRGRGDTVVDVGYQNQGIVAVDNTWVEPMTLRIDGRQVTVIAPHQAFASLVPTGAYLQVLAPNGTTVLSLRSDARGLSRQKVQVVAPPVAWVDVHNPGRVPLRLLDSTTGQDLRSVAPGRTERIQVASGKRSLQASFAGQHVDSVALLASPWSPSRWTIELPRTASLTVHNPNRVAVRAWADGQDLGWIAAGDRVIAPGLALGRVEVTLRADGRRSNLVSTSVAWLEPIVGASVSPQIAMRDGRWGSYRHHRSDRRSGRHGRSGRIAHR